MAVDLNTCVPGQRVRAREGTILLYQKKLAGISWYPHVIDSCTYTDDGYYYSEEEESFLDIVEILPLETTESTTSDKHPSVAWWESCPWITDRTPTEEDGNAVGWVMAKLKDSSDVATVFGPSIALGQPWIHRQDWKPPVLSNKKKAIEIIDKHKEGWTPTLDEWFIISNALKE